MPFSITTGVGHQAINSNNTLGDALPNFSMSFWIKSTSTVNAFINMIEKESGGQNAGWYVLINPSTGFIALGTNSGGFQKNSTANFYDGNWHNLILAYDGAVGVTGYLDGSPLTFPAGAGGTPLTNTTPIFLFSSSSPSLAGQWFDIRFYNITLTSGDATSINAGGNPQPGNTIAEWPITESFGTTLADITGNGNTLTCNLTPTPFSNVDIPPVFQNNGKKNASMFLVI